MGRREDRDSLQSTWVVLEARERGRPFSRKDIEDAQSRADACVPPQADHRTDQPVALSSSRRVFLPALVRVASYQPTKEAAQVPMTK